MTDKLRRVLVIDDNLSTRRTTRLGLELEGFTVDEAANVEEAINKLKTSTYDYVIADVRMPHKSGLSLMEEGQRLCPTAKWILMSAYDFPADEKHDRHLNPLGFLRSPFRISDLVRLMKTWQEEELPPQARLTKYPIGKDTLEPMQEEELLTLLQETLRDEPRESGVVCPSTDDLWDFVAKALSDAEAERIHAHIATCSRCARDVGRLYRGLKYVENRQEVIQQHIDSVIAPPPPKGSWGSGFLKLFRAPSVRWGLAAAAVTALILVLLWQFRRTPPKGMVVKKDGHGPKPAPQIVKDSPPPEPQPQSPPSAGGKDKPMPPSKSHTPQKRRPGGLLVEKPTKSEARFLAMLPQMTLRSEGATGEPSLVAVKPHRTIVLSPTPKLVAEASNIAGPFTFEVDEVKMAGGGFEVVKSDVAGTKGKPVDKPSLTLTKQLERGRIYIWRISAGEGEGVKESNGIFMVAEQRTADAAKKHVNAPLKLAEFYKRHGLYLDAQTTLEEWLTKQPDDAKAQRLKKEIENALDPKDSPTFSP